MCVCVRRSAGRQQATRSTTAYASATADTERGQRKADQGAAGRKEEGLGLAPRVDVPRVHEGASGGGLDARQVPQLLGDGRGVAAHQDVRPALVPRHVYGELWARGMHGHR